MMTFNSDDYHAYMSTGVTDIATVLIRAGKFLKVIHGDKFEECPDLDVEEDSPWLVGGTREFKIGSDGFIRVYKYNGKNIPKHYKKIALAINWVTFYDDDTIICRVKGPKIAIYNAGNSFIARILAGDDYYEEDN